MRVCPECGIETPHQRCPTDGRVTLDAAVLAERDPWIDRKIADKYVIEVRIGRGGMGSVYRARHCDTDGLVAVKVMNAAGLNDAQAVRRFHLEAQNSAGLRHANTIHVHDFGVEDGCPYLVMEYLSGRPLSQVLIDDGPLDWRRAVHIVAQVLKSLWEAHEHPRRIVHRDIKSHNIFVLDHAGQNDFVKVLDFGISRALESSGADTRGPIGTPWYMAPEQWRGGEIDARADLYSVGCLLYELLSGRPPFVVSASAGATERMAALAQKHLNEEPEPLRGYVADDVPEGLTELVHRLLAKDREERPASARAVVEALG